MVKQTVCDKANNALSSYNDALATNNALQVKNETAKKRVANVSCLKYPNIIMYRKFNANMNRFLFLDGTSID